MKRIRILRRFFEENSTVGSTLISDYIEIWRITFLQTRFIRHVVMHHSRLFTRLLRVFRCILSKSGWEGRENGKRRSGVWSAARETAAPHRCMHMCVFTYTIACGGDYSTHKYRHEPEKGVQKSERVLIRVTRKNARVNRIASAMNASHRANFRQFTRSTNHRVRHGFHR